MSSLPFDPRYAYVLDHIDCLLAEAADDRRALPTLPLSFPRASVGALLVGLGRALVRVGECVGGQSAA
jgi:hypothetical protein